jgi:hypothetical protein
VRLRAAAVLAIPLVLALANGCGPTPATGSGSARQEVVGIVTSVQGSSPTDVTEFTLRNQDGQVMSFWVGQLELGGDAFPAGHLREHQVNAEPVAVTYVERGGRREAIGLRDAS